jgi:hypothetical protein
MLAAAGGEPWHVAGYMVIVAAISLLPAYLLPEIHRRDIVPIAAAERATAIRPT